LNQRIRSALKSICFQLFGIPEHHIYYVYVDLETMAVSDEDGMLIKGKSAILLLAKKKEHSSQIVIVGDGVSDMKVLVDAVVDIAIGFVQWLKIGKTRELSDYNVASQSRS
jgi:hypothetical protein